MNKITEKQAIEIMARAMEPEQFEHVHKPDSDGYWKARHKIGKARKRAQKCYNAILPWLAITDAEIEA